MDEHRPHSTVSNRASCAKFTAATSAVGLPGIPLPKALLYWDFIRLHRSNACCPWWAEGSTTTLLKRRHIGTSLFFTVATTGRIYYLVHLCPLPRRLHRSNARCLAHCSLYP